jgi:hypothetical protein
MGASDTEWVYVGGGGSEDMEDDTETDDEICDGGVCGETRKNIYIYTYETEDIGMQSKGSRRRGIGRAAVVEDEKKGYVEIKVLEYFGYERREMGKGDL